MKLFSRPADRVIVKEVQATYGDLPIRKGDVALDLGANIGAASRLMLEKGAGKVIAIEPDPNNYRYARKNLAHQSAVVLWAAVGSKPGRMTMHIRPGKPYLTSGIADKGRVSFKVSVVTLGALLAEFQPAIIKCDIEFGEYDLPELANLPDFVHVLALEIHVRYDLVFANRIQTDAELRAQRRQAANLIAAIEAQGFKSVRRKDKQAKDRPITDDTGFGPFVKSVDAIWTR